jgi:exonuclease SbcD
MRIVHTADWHLGARLRRESRATDLRRAVEAVFAHCESEAADVLLIAGDIFHQGGWSEDVASAVDHLKEASGPFLRRGGTIVALTGNHDPEVFASTLQSALELGHPRETRFGTLWESGKFHLTTRPVLFRLADPDGLEVQFVLMPFPTASRYLDGSAVRYENAEEKQKLLRGAFIQSVERIAAHESFDPGLPRILACHLSLDGAVLPNGRAVNPQEEIVVPPLSLAEGWDYVALGHIHKAQAIANRQQIRYSGSIERIDLAERHDRKGVTLIEVGPGGLEGPPQFLPIDATPFLDLTLDDPEVDLELLAVRHAAIASRALVRCRVKHAAGASFDQIARKVRAAFPRCYELRPWVEERPKLPAAGDLVRDDLSPARGFRETVIAYLREQLAPPAHNPPPDADAVLALAESLLADEST